MIYVAKDRGVTWSVHATEFPILHNLAEWQAKAIAAILNGR